MLQTGCHRFDLKFSWINQLTQLFYHNERAVFCWLSRLSRLNLVASVFSLIVQTVLYTLDGVKRMVRCSLLIRVLFYSIPEYSG
jgi:hypothetical protein